VPGTAPTGTAGSATGGLEIWSLGYYYSAWDVGTTYVGTNNYTQVVSYPTVSPTGLWVLSSSGTPSTGSAPVAGANWTYISDYIAPVLDWSPSVVYTTGQSVIYNGQTWIVEPGSTSSLGVPPSDATNSVWNLVVTVGGSAKVVQDIASTYYWISSFQYWIGLINKTIYDPTDNLINIGSANYSTNPFSCAWGDMYWELYIAAAIANGTTAGVFSAFTTAYPNLLAFVKQFTPPQFAYNEATNTFSMYAPVDTFGNLNGLPFSSNPPSTTVAQNTFFLASSTLGVSEASTGFSSAVTRPFFNTNMYGLFANFPVKYWNTTALNTTFPAIALPSYNYNATGTLVTAPTADAPPGYAYEVLFINQNMQNTVDFRTPPYTNTAPLGFVGLPFQALYWVNTQDFPSVDSLWSPIDGLFLTTTLMPVRREAMSRPLNIGESDIGYASVISPSSFEPVVVDLSLDLSEMGCQQYRRFASFSPTAEFRLSDLGNSKDEIHSIDFKIWWRSRLNGKLYPVNMFNLSTVSVKLMFKNKDAD